jgi:hypothetical protein
MFLGRATLAVTSASAAHAGSKSLLSAPIPAGTGTVYCDVTNIDPTNPIDVTGEIDDINGVAVHGPSTQTVLPGTGTFFGPSSGSAAYCKLTVNGSTKNLRAMGIYDNGTDYTVSLPAY